MKIAFPYNSWRGGFFKSIQRSVKKLGHQTFSCKRYNSSLINKVSRRTKVNSIVQRATFNKEKYYNKDLYNQLTNYNPDVFINISGSGVFPETLKKIRDNLKCTTICFIADNPCDPAPHRDEYFAMSLRYYNVLLLPEPIWTKIINNLAPQAKVIPFYGGYDKELFFPVLDEEISEDDKQKFSCDISFTGNSYSENPEGSYRAGILDQLEDFSLKIWGDKGWKFRFPFYPKLKEAYQGERLSYNDLLKLYKISSINLNIPSPQILSGFQPRIFEIAASKGFQIVDHSDEFYSIFEKDEIVTFKSINDLLEKVKYYLDHDKERKDIIEKMHKKIVNDYTWERQIEKTFRNIFS